MVDMTSEYGDCQIRRYMRLDHFIDLLSSKELFVNARRAFADKSEGSLPIGALFAVHEFHKPPSKEQIEADMDKTIQIKAGHAEYGLVPASCWTLKQGESVLMWECFAQKFGVCVRSTVDRFLQSIPENDYDIEYGSMTYGGELSFRNDPLFSKLSAYSDEQEFRFYFHRKDGKQSESGYIKVPVDISKLILDVTISPYFSSPAASKLRDMLQKEFPDISFLTSRIRI